MRRHGIRIALNMKRPGAAPLKRFHSLGVSPYEAKIFSTVADARKWIEESGFASRGYSIT